MSRRRSGVVVSSLSLVAGIATATSAAFAFAQDAPPEAPPPAFVAPPPGYEPPTQYAQAAPAAPVAEEVGPTFLTLDRMDASTRVGLQVGFDKLDRVSLSDGFFMRYEPYGQYVFPGRIAGVYGQWAITHVFSSNGADQTGYGNLELGGFFLPMHNSNLILRAGLVADTASTGNGLFVNAATAYERFTDLLLIAPNYTTLRVSGSTVQRWDNIFLRADLGFDTVVDRPSGTSAASVFGRGNVAAGFRVDPVDLTAELVNVAAINGTYSGGITNRLMHTAAISVRTIGENQFHLGMVFPLDQSSRGDYWIISVGYQRAMNL